MKISALVVATFLFLIHFPALQGAGAASDISYEEAFKLLKDGNKRFVLGISKYPRQSAARRQRTVIKGQHPFATVITCSDSRAPVELLFDQGIGDTFVIRVAGNVVQTNEAGSIEYGVEHLGTPICVVMGHTHCGAVTAVAKGTQVHGNIPALVAPIIPAIAAARQKHPHHYGDDFIEKAIVENVWQSIEDLLKISPTVARRVLDGKVKVVGAVYELETGKVDWLGEHPEQKRILSSHGIKSLEVGHHGKTTHTPTPVATTHATSHASHSHDSHEHHDTASHATHTVAHDDHKHDDKKEKGYRKINTSHPAH